mmetsp:Transcript_27762/g.58345  ORF Transcript_27762/g.58345 Transcript_27762/m.58345 type:complete len:124 (-) Transcript_27762:48-419(-)
MRGLLVRPPEYFPFLMRDDLTNGLESKELLRVNEVLVDVDPRILSTSRSKLCNASVASIDSVFFAPDEITMVEPSTTTASPAQVIQPGKEDTPTAAPMKDATIGSISITIDTTTGSKYFIIAM